MAYAMRVRSLRCSVAVLSACATSVASAQLLPLAGPWDSGLQTLSTADDSASVTPAGYPVAVFHDSFRQSTLDALRWKPAPRAERLAALGGDGGVRLAADDAAPFAELQSRPIDLSVLAGARVRVRAAATDAGGEPLELEYLAIGDSWRALPAVGSSQDARLRAVERELPADAMHAGFRLRLRTAANGGWAIYDVAIFGKPVGAAQVLVMQTEPAGAPLVLATCGAAGQFDVQSPARVSTSDGQRVAVVAPPVLDGLVLSHFIVDEAEKIDRQRAITLTMDQPRTVVAHYRPARDGDVVLIAVRSEPRGGVPIALGDGDQPALIAVQTDAMVPCLRGEQLRLHAAPRTERLVFSNWRVSGKTVTGGPSLAIRADGATAVTAVYALLGDMNGDGALDSSDVDAFCLALAQPTEFAAKHPQIDGATRGDINGDGLLDERDIGAFVELLVSP